MYVVLVGYQHQWQPFVELHCIEQYPPLCMEEPILEFYQTEKDVSLFGKNERKI